MRGGRMADPLGPVPMEEEVGHGKLRPRAGLIAAETILWKPGGIEDVEKAGSGMDSYLAQIALNIRRL